MSADLLIRHISCLYTLDPNRAGLGEMMDVSVSFKDGKLDYLGPDAHAPSADTIIDGSGQVALPGLVDSHTHSVWAGSRSDEFRRRLAGESYSAILEEGGGILSTVRHTRAASMEELIANCRARLSGMRARGVTTVEIKSGYGLNPETEARLLQAARACDDTLGVVTTFLGAHAVPPEMRGDRTAYVQQVIEEQLPHCAPYADAIDVYCDRGAFTLEESVAILTAGQKMGLSIKAHSEQVEHTGIAAAASAMGATSVDHLERLDDRGVAALATNNTVAVLLPGAQLYLKDDPPPTAALREAGVKMAVASDLNPGSSPVHDLWTCATLSCLIQGLTIEEVIVGMTRNAGMALGRPDLGWLGEGSAADLALFRPPPGEPPTVASLVQHMGGHVATAVVRAGKVVVTSTP